MSAEPIPEQFEISRAKYLATLRDHRALPFLRLIYSLNARLWSAFPGHMSLICAIGLTFLVCRFAVGAEGRWIIAEATAYCPCSLCCDTRTERTANGTDTNARPYAVAASPNLPLGTVLLIPVGVGYLDQTYPRESQRLFAVDDRGGALRTEWRRTGITRLDLRYKSHDYAVRFGRRTIAVLIFD
jgi:3D (Asp-Asp-Asp) domain-containing protein